MPDKIVDLWSGGLRHREEFIERGKEHARVALPYFAPRDEGEVPDRDDYPRRFSTRAAQGVVTLSSKMRMGMFPTTHPFFRYEADPAELAAIGVRPEDAHDVVLQLSRRERAIASFLDVTGFGARAFVLFQHILQNGNYLLRQLKSGRFVGYRLDRFQVERDGTSRPRSIMFKEDVRKEAFSKLGPSFKLPDTPGLENHTTIYTRAEVTEEDYFDTTGDDRLWEMWQETSEGVELPGTRRGDIKNVELPLVPVRLFESDEHYGRSLFDIILGSVESLEGLSQALTEDAAMMAAGIWRLARSAGIDGEEFVSKDAGEYVYADQDEIEMIRTNKSGDFAVAANFRDQIDRELSAMFLSFLPRDSERTTAEEIRRVTQELLETFGGAFSLLSSELQLPVMRLTEKRMMDLGKLPKVQADSLESLFRPRVVTGVDAIGRGRELAAIQQLIDLMQQGVGPEEAARRLKPGVWTLAAAALGLDPEAVVWSEEEFQEQEEQRAQQRAVSENLGPIIQQASQIREGRNNG
jgi:hypothetical protein